MISFFNTFFSRLRARANARKAMRELDALTDRELADLGITRFDIPRVVHGVH